MSNILKQTSGFHFLDKPIEQIAGFSRPLPNIEALRLYRDVIKFSRQFTWTDKRGVPWFLILRQSARQEFELSRQEHDPVKLGQMLITGRDALMKAQSKFVKKEYDFVKKVDETRNK